MSMILLGKFPNSCTFKTIRKKIFYYITSSFQMHESIENEQVSFIKSHGRHFKPLNESMRHARI